MSSTRPGRQRRVRPLLAAAAIAALLSLFMGLALVMIPVIAILAAVVAYIVMEGLRVWSAPGPGAGATSERDQVTEARRRGA